MITINTHENPSAQRLIKAFSQFKRTHWHPNHIHRLKPSEFIVLHTIANTSDCDDSGLMVSQISSSLGIASPTVTQLINGLNSRKLIEKTTDTDDKRVVRIKLSESGEILVKKASKEFYTKFNGLAEYLGDKKSNELANLLFEVSDYFKNKNNQHNIERT